MASNPNMEDDDLPETVETITPTATDTSSSKHDSPVEKIKKELPERVHREFIAATDDHALVKTAGSKKAIHSSVDVDVQKMFTDDMYVDTDVFFREWRQNHLAAVTREAKRRLVNEYGEDALFRTVQHTHPDMEADKRNIRLPKKTENIIDAAKDLGYHPSIEFIMDFDDGKLTTRDNGIGMTTGEAIEVWNEPAQSGSGVDLSSAGKMGIGALTWVTLAGEKSAMTVRTTTKRQTNTKGETVPQRDRDGYVFYSYFGGILPVPGSVDFESGTEFEIPIQDSVDPEGFKSALQKYAEVLPTQISWVEIRNGERDEDEFDKSTFLGRYPREPAVVVDRPGEFTIALDTSDVVDKNATDTFLMDNPIDRNTGRYSSGFDTLWNDHIQLHNEQGLIVAGPNRGRRHEDLDELAGDANDITDESKPMPDVPMPEPVNSRDSFKRDEAHNRFFTYAEHIAKEEELSVVSEFVNNFLGAGSKDEAIEYLREKDSTYTLFKKLAKKHAGHRTSKQTNKLAKWFDTKDAFEFSLDRLPTVKPGQESHNGRENTSRNEKRDFRVHRQYHLVELLVSLREEVSVATSSTRGDPNLKENRKSRELGKLIGEDGRWPLFVGATINKDRARVIWQDENYPDAAIIKVNSYGTWQSEPWNAHLVKNVPMTFDDADDCDEDWHVPEHIHKDHTRTGPSSGDSDTTDDGKDLTDPDNFQDRPVDLRCTENAAIDMTTTIGDLMETLDDTDPGRSINGTVDVGQPHLVVFPDNTDDNISDHYELSEYAGIIKCTAEEAEALLKFEQVYEYPEYEPMLRSTTHSVYDARNGRGWNESIETTLDRPTDTVVWVYDDADPLVDALYGNDISECGHDVPTTHEQYEAVRRAILDEFTPGLDSDTEWVAVFWPDDWKMMNRVKAFHDLYTDHLYRHHAVRVRHLSFENPNHTWDTYSVSIDDAVERALFPAWDDNSPIWSRMNDTYKGPKDYEKAMHRALRDAGIDPAETHPPARLERVIGHLFERGNQ